MYVHIFLCVCMQLTPLGSHLNQFSLAVSSNCAQGGNSGGYVEGGRGLGLDKGVGKRGGACLRLTCASLRINSVANWRALKASALLAFAFASAVSVCARVCVWCLHLAARVCLCVCVCFTAAVLDYSFSLLGRIVDWLLLLLLLLLLLRLSVCCCLCCCWFCLCWCCCSFAQYCLYSFCCFGVGFASRFVIMIFFVHVLCGGLASLSSPSLPLLFPRCLFLLLEQVGALLSLALSPWRAELRMLSLSLFLSCCLACPGSVRALSGSAGVDVVVSVSVDVCRVVVVVVLVLLLMLLSDVRVLCSLGASKLCCQLIFSN